MKRPLCLLVLAVMLCGGCGDDDPASPGGSGSGITGTWTLASWVWTRDTNPSDQVDWYDLGLRGTLVVGREGGFTAAPALPGGFGEDDGELTVEGDAIYWDGQNDEEWVPFTVVGDRLTLVWPEAEFVDMDENGSPEDAWLVVSYER